MDALEKDALTPVTTRSCEAKGLRVLFLIDSIPSFTDGGTELQVLQMIQMAKDSGIRPSLAVLRESGWIQEDRIGCSVFRGTISSLSDRRGIFGLLQLVRWIRRQRPHVVMTFLSESNLIGPVLARAVLVPVVIGTRRNLNHWMNKHDQIAQRASNLFVTRILANSEAARNAVVETERADASRIDVLYNGLDLQKHAFDPIGRNRVRNLMGVAKEEVLIGSVGRLYPVKGHSILLEAFARLAKRNIKFRGVVVGDGPQRTALGELAQSLGIEDLLFLAGSRDDVPAWMSALDIFVLPSFAEGFSNVLLECMAAGIPCVATNVGGNPEALKDNGVLIPANDAEALTETLARLIASRETREGMATAARARAADFDLRCMQGKFAQYLQGIAPKSFWSSQRKENLQR